MDKYPNYVQNSMQSSAAAAGANGTSSQHDETAVHEYVNSSAAANGTASQNNQTAIDEHCNSSAAAAGANGTSSQHDETAVHEYVNSSAAANGTASQNNQTAIDEHCNSSAAAAANGTSYLDDETAIQGYFNSSSAAVSGASYLENQAAIEKYFNSTSAAVNGASYLDDQAAIENYFNSSAASANGTSYQNDETAIQEYFNSSAAGTWSQDLHEFATIEEYLNSFPIGYRFVPTDEELIMSYLKNKIDNKPLPPNNIPEVNLYSKDPAQLAAEHKPCDETEWYFFTPRDKKYPNGTRPNRGIPGGYWKPTGTDKPIVHGPHQLLVGYRKTLDFMEGPHPDGDKTNWKMHEYIVIKDKDDDDNSQNNSRPKDDMTLDDWVLCRVYKKKRRNGGNEASTSETHPATVNLPYDFMVGISNELEDQPIGNVSRNNEASLMAGNKSIEFEDQRLSNPKQGPIMHGEPGNFMVGNGINGFEGRPILYVSQSNEAFSMDGNTGNGFNPKQGPMHGELGNFMAGNGNGFEGQPILNVSHNNQAFSMAGSASIAFEGQRLPNPKQGPMHGEPGNFVVGNSNEFEGQQIVNLSHNNGAFPMAGNTSIAFENQGLSNPIPNQGPQHEEPVNFMVGNSNEFGGHPIVNISQNNGTFLIAGNTSIALKDPELCNSNQGPKHEEPAGNFMAGNMSNEFEGQPIVNASQSNEAFLIVGNTGIAFEDQGLSNPNHHGQMHDEIEYFQPSFLATPTLFGTDDEKVFWSDPPKKI
ncbi:hypothetical protein DITRI_Ditri12bG0107600 [Diplodiscus trichospermus]